LSDIQEKRGELMVDRQACCMSQDRLGGPLLSVKRVDILPGQPLQQRRLFQLQGKYTGIAYVAW
jgi:hypothetical protein